MQMYYSIFHIKMSSLHTVYLFFSFCRSPVDIRAGVSGSERKNRQENDKTCVLYQQLCIYRSSSVIRVLLDAGMRRGGRWGPQGASLVSAQLFFGRSEEHTSELQSRPHISYAVFCLKKKTNTDTRIPCCTLEYN